MTKLRVALAKGALLPPTTTALAAAGFDIDGLREPGRRLYFETETADYIVARPADVPTYVEWGAVDVGFVGSDILLEEEYQVFDLLDLGYGRCRFVLAVPEKNKADWSAGSRVLKIATKYPKVASAYLAERGIQAELIKLYGAMELAPLVGLADGIIDLMSTGRTLADNGLAVVDEIAKVSCRLIANYVSYKLQSTNINELVEVLSAGLKNDAPGA